MPDVPKSEKNILLVEDSRTFRHLISAKMHQDFGLKPIICKTYSELDQILQEDAEKIDLAITDLNIPGADIGAGIKRLEECAIPTILLSGHSDENIRSELGLTRLGDYIVKDSPHFIDFLMMSLRRFLQMDRANVLVVDGKSEISETIKPALEAQLLNVYSSDNREASLSKMFKDRVYDLIVVEVDQSQAYDENQALFERLRDLNDHEGFRIIAAITDEDRMRTSTHLKSDIDDYIKLPAFTEELQWRIGKNVSQSDQLARLKECAMRDYLTGLNNRRYFFEESEKRIDKMMRQKSELQIAMIDIDHFKKLNDTYGHDVGDLVLKQVAQRFDELCGKKHLLARLGGEEFAVLIDCKNIADAEAFCNELRSAICDKPVPTEDDGDLNVSVSIGIANVYGEEDFINYITAADQYLYMAKSAGRNRAMAEPTIAAAA